MTRNTAVYLKHARLKEFRTIRDTRADFEPGLNIIIGKNGAGKSNFFQYLETSLEFQALSPSHHDAHLIFCREKDEYSFKMTGKMEASVENGAPVVSTNQITFDVKKNNTTVGQFNRLEDYYAFLNREVFFFSPVFISHGLPVDYSIVNQPFSFKMNRKGVIEEYPYILSGRNPSRLFENIFNYFFLKGISHKHEGKRITEELLDELIHETILLLAPVEKQLGKFTDIDGVRLNKDYSVVFDKTRKEFSISNLFLEFEVGRQWLPFSHLSDGTRRLFYIISEILFPTLFHFQGNKISFNTSEIGKIVLIEEPELGLHPFQLESLLQVLKEVSAEHQIILTTHAPQVLDILDKNQLNRINIARLSRNGTKMRRLTRDEREKAALYMEEEAYLSDYWRFSDLEE